MAKKRSWPGTRPPLRRWLHCMQWKGMSGRGGTNSPLTPSPHSPHGHTHAAVSLSLSLLQVDKREGTVLRDAVRLIEILGVGSGRQAPGLKRAGWTRLLGAQGFHIQSWSYEIFIYRVTQNYGENLLLTKIWDVLPSSLGSR